MLPKCYELKNTLLQENSGIWCKTLLYVFNIYLTVALKTIIIHANLTKPPLARKNCHRKKRNKVHSQSRKIECAINECKVFSSKAALARKGKGL